MLKMSHITLVYGCVVHHKGTNDMRKQREERRLGWLWEKLLTLPPSSSYCKVVVAVCLDDGRVKAANLLTEWRTVVCYVLLSGWTLWAGMGDGRAKGGQWWWWPQSAIFMGKGIFFSFLNSSSSIACFVFGCAVETWPSSRILVYCKQQFRYANQTKLASAPIKRSKYNTVHAEQKKCKDTYT